MVGAVAILIWMGMTIGFVARFGDGRFVPSRLPECTVTVLECSLVAPALALVITSRWVFAAIKIRSYTLCKRFAKSRMKSLTLFLALQAALVQGQGNNAAEMLIKASMLGELDRAETLISAGVDPNTSTETGRTPLYYAALYSRNEIAAMLLAHGADPNTRAKSKTSGSEFPETPLQVAASKGNLQMALMLTQAGAQVNAKAETGRTPLQFAVVAGHLDMTRYLVAKGAVVNSRDAEGASPLDDAVWRGYLEVTAILLARGAVLNEAETMTGATPINEAAFQGKTQLIRYLLQFKPNLGIPDKRGYTALENAIRKGNADAAVLLLQAQGQELKAPAFLRKLLSAAVKKDESVVVESLLHCGTSVVDLLPSGATLLDAAASEGAIKSLRVLLEAGADPNGTGKNGTSPLEDACLKGFYSVAEMLLDNGALVNHVNEGSGRTALYAAASFGRGDVVSLLLTRRADPNVCGKDRRSPYKAALENGYADIAEQIQRHGGTDSCIPLQSSVKGRLPGL